MDTVTVDVVLAAVDGSDASRHAIEVAVPIAERYGASLHVLFVSDAVDHSAAMIADAEAAADPVDVQVTSSVAEGFSQQRLGQHPGTVICEAAADAGADFIVIPREQIDSPEVNILEKAAEYVLGNAQQPVLSV
ncbi:MAG: universal stress protein [Natrialbaceae archaeon]|nr:universal stress protein [Natrialbaceae archaeon]